MKLKFHAMSFSLFKCIFHNNTFQTFTFENISFSHDRTQDGLIFKIKDLRTALMFPKNQTTCICVMCARYIWSILGSQWWCEWVITHLRPVLHPHLFVFLRSKWPGHFGDTLDYWKKLQKIFTLALTVRNAQTQWDNTVKVCLLEDNIHFKPSPTGRQKPEADRRHR